MCKMLASALKSKDNTFPLQQMGESEFDLFIPFQDLLSFVTITFYMAFNFFNYFFTYTHDSFTICLGRMGENMTAKKKKKKGRQKER